MGIFGLEDSSLNICKKLKLCKTLLYNSKYLMNFYISIYFLQARLGVELWEVGAPPLPQDVATPQEGRDSCSSSSGSSSCSGPWWSPQPPPPPMSLRERGTLGGRASPPIQQGGLTRSRSFGGLLSGRRSVTLRAGWADQGILGQTSPSPRDVRRVTSLPPHVKVPKTPRPERAVLILSCVIRGLGDSVQVTHRDINTLHQAQRDYQLSLVSTLNFFIEFYFFIVQNNGVGFTGIFST